jgi:hypothetical protein
MSKELGDEATYLARGVGSISFHMPLGDVLELSDIIFVLCLRKNLLSVSCMRDVYWRVSFEGRQCTISDCSLASPRTLARRVREAGVYRLLIQWHVYLPMGGCMSLLVCRRLKRI